MLVSRHRYENAPSQVTSVRVKDRAGMRIVVSAGPTREALDPVRFLTNRSTGRMGYATVYPTSMIGKILVCQVLALLLV